MTEAQTNPQANQPAPAADEAVMQESAPRALPVPPQPPPRPGGPLPNASLDDLYNATHAS